MTSGKNNDSELFTSKYTRLKETLSLLVFPKAILLCKQGTTTVVIAWQLDLQLPMQSVAITTNVSLNPALCKVYSTHYVIKFVSDLWQVGCFLCILRFPQPTKLTAMI